MVSMSMVFARTLFHEYNLRLTHYLYIGRLRIGIRLLWNHKVHKFVVHKLVNLSFFFIFAANTFIIMAEKYYKLTFEQLNDIVSDAVANAIKKNDWSTIKILSSFIQTQKKWRFHRWNRHFLMILNVWITSRKQ